MSTPEEKTTVRISYLDGHRGVAILLVVMFHAFSRWSELLPYGDDYANFPLFQYGYLGVQLFFIISGFVILMTLERCRAGIDFLYRRWLRLFPAMLLCSLLVFCTAGFFFERPNGQPLARDLLPGLTFIDPYVWTKLLDLPFSSLEGAYWSLYVEFIFYLFAGVTYFLWGSRCLVWLLFAACGFAYLIEHVYLWSGNPLSYYAHAISGVLSFKHFGWFAAGSSYYLFSVSNKHHWFCLGFIFSLISSMLVSRLELGPFLALLAISIIFALSLISKGLQSVLSNKVLLFLGFVSYPLYLIHENMMIALILKLHTYFPAAPLVLLPLVSIFTVSSLAYFIAKYFEKPLKNILSDAVLNLGKVIAAVIPWQRLKERLVLRSPDS